MSVEASTLSLSRTTIFTEDNPSLGTLVILPREVRDEIYRYLVIGRYNLYQCSCDGSAEIYTITKPQLALKPANDHPNLAISEVSKVTHDEATSILYSESVFRYRGDYAYVRVPWTPPPASAFDRLMKIECEFDWFHWSDEWYDAHRFIIDNQLYAILDTLTGFGKLRNMLLIKFTLGPPDTCEALFSHVIRRLKALVGFRTVIIVVGKESEHIARTMEQEMVPTMGTATVSCVDLNTHLKFHPFEHMKANLSSQVKSMQTVIDKMEGAAAGLEEGN